MKAKDMDYGLLVMAKLPGKPARPAMTVHREGRDWWVSFTDHQEPHSARVRPSQLTRKGS